MPLLKIRYLGDPILRKKSLPVEEIDDRHRELFSDMLETMYHNKGVGLAAPQVGISERIIVLDRDPEGGYGGGGTVAVNPVILRAEGEDEMEEGCLSIPEIRDVVKRPRRVVVRGLDAEGEWFEVDVDGLLARVYQHEIDHLEGRLFIDHLGPLQRELQIKRWTKIREGLKGAVEG
jgi:peptide deformylase